MAMLALVSNEEKIIQRKIINKITEEEKDIAMSIFNKYKRKGVISNEFSDDKWKISSEIKTVVMDFTVNEMLIKKYLRSYTPREFQDILKYYICFCLGQYSLEVLLRILASIKKAMEATNCFLVMPRKTEVLTAPGVSDFIDIFPYANEELIMECIDNYTFNNYRHRKMAEYQSYFLFDKMLDKFWEEASNCEKDLYYPIYLWWKISMIIPIRVTEFTVIPKDCIGIVNNKWMLKIRRTQLKGKARRIHGYRLDEDYKIYEYAVTGEIASMILDYKDRAIKYDEAEIDSLFSDDMFVSLMNIKNLERMRHLNASHLALLLGYFYTDVIEHKYEFRVLTKEDILMVDTSGELKHLNEYEIVKISLGDSRHIAMQNMLLNGCNILMAKEITGHESADMIFHYAGNMKNLVKCRAYSLFQMAKKREVAIEKVTKNNKSISLPQPEVPGTEVDGGLCYSVSFVLEQDAKDCFAVAGVCENCRYFKSKDGSLLIRKEHERILEERIIRLSIWLNSARTDKNKDEFRVISNQLMANVENLQNSYIKDLHEGEKI